MLDDSMYLAEPRDRFTYAKLDKFIVWTNNVEHPVLKDTPGKPDMIDLNNSVISLINDILITPETIERRWVIYSNALAPYITTHLMPHML